MSVERIMSMHEKNEELVGGETIIYKGEEHTVPPMTDEELEQMKKEGEEIAEIEIEEASGETIKLIDMNDGRKLYKRLQALNIEGNTQAFWYLWREAQIEKEFKKLPETKVKQIKKILGRK